MAASSYMPSVSLNKKMDMEESRRSHILIIVTTRQLPKSLGKYQNFYDKSISMAKVMEMDSNFGDDKLPIYDVLEWEDSMMVDFGGDFDHFYYNELSRQIKKYYFDYDGFIIIHNINCLAYTSSYLSFIFENLQKPIVLTSCAVSDEEAFSDGKQNLIYSMIIAGMRQRNKSGNGTIATFGEVVVCFNKTVFRGCRVTRNDPNSQDGFYSPNYPPLAKFGTSIKINYKLLREESHSRLGVFCPSIMEKKGDDIKTILIRRSDSIDRNTIASRNTSRNTSRRSTPRKSSKRPSIQLLNSFSTKASLDEAVINSPIQDRKEEEEEDDEEDRKKQEVLVGDSSIKKGYRNKHSIRNVLYDGWVNVIVVYFCPLMATSFLKSIVLTNCKKYNRIGFVFVWYGVGNTNTDPEVKKIIQEAVHKYNAEIVVTTGCSKGHVNISVYAAGNYFSGCGLLNGSDMTIEACVAKLSYLMTKGYNGSKLRDRFENNLVGELTPMNEITNRIVNYKRRNPLANINININETETKPQVSTQADTKVELVA